MINCPSKDYLKNGFADQIIVPGYTTSENYFLYSNLFVEVHIIEVMTNLLRRIKFNENPSIIYRSLENFFR